MKTTSFRSLFLAGLLAPGLLGCAPIVDTRGNQPTPERLAQIKPGQLKRDDVLAILGTPSSAALFGDDTWYYISARTESLAFFAPKTVERSVVAIRFAKDGVVERVETLAQGDGREVEFVERETPTAGKDLTVIQQLLGNVGRFSSDAPSSGGYVPGGDR